MKENNSGNSSREHTLEHCKFCEPSLLGLYNTPTEILLKDKALIFASGLDMILNNLMARLQ